MGIFKNALFMGFFNRKIPTLGNFLLLGFFKNALFMGFFTSRKPRSSDNLTYTPFQIIDLNGSAKETFGMRAIEQTFYEKNPQILEKAKTLLKEYPVIFSEKELLFVVL